MDRSDAPVMAALVACSARRLSPAYFRPTPFVGLSGFRNFSFSEPMQAEAATGRALEVLGAGQQKQHATLNPRMAKPERSRFALPPSEAVPPCGGAWRLVVHFVRTPDRSGRTRSRTWALLDQLNLADVSTWRFLLATNWVLM